MCLPVYVLVPMLDEDVDVRTTLAVIIDIDSCSLQNSSEGIRSEPSAWVLY